MRRRTAALEAALDERILVLDGATGTAFEALGLGPEDYGGPRLEGCNEHLALTRPDVCLALHESYLRAGCDIVETNTFGASPIVLAEYGLAEGTREINREAARLARRACARFESASRLRWVAGSLGPTTKALSVTGGATFDQLRDGFAEQARGLIEGGADYLLLETCQDTRNVKAGLLGIERARVDLGLRIPVAVSVTIEPSGTMLAGQDVEALCVSLLHVDLLYLGLNCATGPALMSGHLRTLAECAKTRTACVPNAGLPDADGRYPEGPAELAAALRAFAERGWVNLVGGCCGSTPAHVQALVEQVGGLAPRTPGGMSGTWLSGVDAQAIDEDTRPVIVGERTNVLGSRRFKRLIDAGRYEAAAEVGRAQVRGGAHLIDVCLQDPDADEVARVEAFLAEVTRAVRVPLVIDTTDPAVMEQALTWCQGKALLNSVNLESGPERLGQVVELARRYGAALVVGLIDEDPENGMAVTVERKLSAARRCHRLLTKQHDVPDEDIVWDALVFPCGTGDAAYEGSARETIEGVRALKQAFPLTKTILGVSNVSFGLPEAGRETLNSVFLYHCVQAGLDLAIVNSERMERYPSISQRDRDVSEDLIWMRGEDPVTAFVSHFRTVAPRSRRERPDLPVAESLQACVIEGSKEGLENSLDRALALPEYADALDVVNGPLMAGMEEVGRLFNGGELIVAEVLQSAGVMKAAVEHLEPHLVKLGGRSLGKVVLATVKGDVHDIGKNLVHIVLANNGFEVVDLGIRVPSDGLIRAIHEHQPDVVGLSGLLVKSAHAMVATAQDLAAAGIRTPLLVGGAALTPAFVRRRIAPAYGAFVGYGRDPMQGLDMARQLIDPARRPALEAARAAETLDAEDGTSSAVAAQAGADGPSPAVRRDVVRPPDPPLERVVLPALDLDEVWDWVNPQMLYGKHLGLRGSVRRLFSDGDAKYRMLERMVADVKTLCRGGAMSAEAVYRFLPVMAEGEVVRVLDPSGDGELCRFAFTRQRRGERLCLADYVLSEPERPDHLGFFVTTAGKGIRARVATLRDQGHYLESHILGALAVETAEAAAEWLHARMRRLWGIADREEEGIEDCLRSRYQGRRYSFGYPACPDLEAQSKLFDLLDPSSIDVFLTEEYMMDPEASVSGLVFHHPDARYFSV